MRWLARVRRPGAYAVFIASLCVCGLVLPINILRSELEPSSAWGMTYGGAAVGLMLGVMAYGVRRRAPRYGPGSARGWLQFHVYGGVLFLVLVLMHTAFRAPRGVLGWALWLLAIYVVLSGLVGLLLQRWLPRVLSSAFTTEVNFERIPALVDVLRGRAEDLVYSCDDSVQRFYEINLQPAFASPQPRLRYFVDAAGGIHARVAQLEHLRLLLPTDREKLDALKQLVASKLEMDAQYTLQRALRVWLMGHVPLTVLLLVLVGFHLFTIWYY